MSTGTRLIAESQSAVVSARAKTTSPTGLVGANTRRLLCNPLGAAGVAIVFAFLVLAALAPWIAPHNPLELFRGHRLESPSIQFWFGTDEVSRDVFSRILYGARVSITVGLVAVGLGTAVGATIGLSAGYTGGWLESFLMRVVDTQLAFPGVIVGLGVAAILGPGQLVAGIAVGIATIPQTARLARATLLGQKDREYVYAARVIGATGARVVVRHILPNVISPLIVHFALALGFAVFLEAGLSFLGLGVQPPDPSWGQMLAASQQYLRQAPWYGLFVGIPLSLFILGLSLLADGLRDALDPRLVNRR